MKRKLPFISLFSFVLIFSLAKIEKVNAQTDGTLTFTYTQAVPSGTTATKNVMALWIEDNAGTFIKTKMRYIGGGTSDHLPTWVSKSAQNIVDASSGATLPVTTPTAVAAFGTKTITWDGKSASTTTTVADGTYKVWIESSYCNPQPPNGQHWLITSFTFTKGSTAFHSTPTGDANFSGITIDWVPATSSGVQNMEGKNAVNVYPNPTDGIVKVEIPNALNGSISVENILGATVYEENVNISGSTTKTIDLSKLAKGTYFVKVKDNSTKEDQKFKVVLSK